jgi:tetratricopeptide (TPR) repeat protein
MQHDFLGNPLTGARPDTAKAVDDFVEGFLAYETRAEGIVEAADADGGCCIANVYAGLLWMLLEAPDAAERAGKYHQAAERASAGATERERMNVAVLRAWIEGEVPNAIRLCDAASDRFPRDLVMVKLQQYFEFNRGNSPAMLRSVLKVLGHNPEVAYVHGMAAFAYEQCHLLNEAEHAARTALGLKRKDPWAQHALAHVMLTRGRVDEGARFLQGIAGTWTALNSFMLTHLWWHLALFKLSQGRFADVLEIYDRHCWGIAKDYSQDQIGAVSLLARMEIAGIDVGTRWQDLGNHLAARARDTVLPFLTVQYLYGLARARRTEADSLLDAVRSRARTGPTHEREVWREVALPAAEGLIAYARGEHEIAWRHLSRAMPRMIEIGGSHAQRDLFDQILLDTAIKARHTVAAQQMLELRRAADPQGVPLNTALGEVYAELGLTTLSREARLRAAATRARHPR